MRLLPAALLLLVSACLAGCGDEKPRPPAPPPAPLEADLRPTTRPPEVPRGAPASVSFRQIMILYRPVHEKPSPRTREDAYAFAKSLIERLRAGEKMELLLEYTDDLDEQTGKPFNSGSVTLARDSLALPAIKKAAFSTPIGQVAPEPVDSGQAFVVIRRDA